MNPLDSVPSAYQHTAPPPIAHTKNTNAAAVTAAAAAAAATWGTPMYDTTLGTSPGSVLQQDIYAPTDAMYRRPTVFVSQAPYQGYNRVVPPPAHNGSTRQVLKIILHVKT